MVCGRAMHQVVQRHQNQRQTAHPRRGVSFFAERTLVLPYTAPNPWTRCQNEHLSHLRAQIAQPVDQGMRQLVTCIVLDRDC